MDINKFSQQELKKSEKELNENPIGIVTGAVTAAKGGHMLAKNAGQVVRKAGETIGNAAKGRGAGLVYTDANANKAVQKSAKSEKDDAKLAEIFNSIKSPYSFI